MLFTKPKNVRYVDMAIWCDQHMYDDDVDENKLFEYLWHLSFMLAKKANYFNKFEYYDDFATYMATNVYFRIKNPKQFKDGSKMDKIKSVLNYIKATIYPRKVSFEQEHYSQVLSKPTEDEENVEIDVNYTFSDMLSESVDSLSKVEFNTCLYDITKTFRYYLKDNIYYKDRLTWNNIYISCLLTILNSIVIDKKTLERIKSFKYKEEQEYINKVWAIQSENDIILYHLDPEMRDYIKVLVRKLKHVFAEDLSSCMHTYIPSNNSMSYVALAELNGKTQYSREESVDEN